MNKDTSSMNVWGWRVAGFKANNLARVIDYVYIYIIYYFIFLYTMFIYYMYYTLILYII